MSRDEGIEAGRVTRSRLGQDADRDDVLGRDDTAPGFAQLMDEAAYAGVWARPGLAMDERLICALAVTGLQAPTPVLEGLVRAALNEGIPARSVLEVFVHCGLYGGFVSTEAACRQAHGVFSREGVQVPDEPARNESLEWLDESGQTLMRRLHGERAGKGYAAPDNPATSALYGVAIRFGYGDLWSRPGLDFRQRLLCAIAAFTALRLESQLVKFSHAAMDNGFTREEVQEAIMQTAPYSGFPPALNALASL